MMASENRGIPALALYIALDPDNYQHMWKKNWKSILRWI